MKAAPASSPKKKKAKIELIDLTLESSSDDDEDDLVEEEPKSETPELVRDNNFASSMPLFTSKGSVTPPIINLGTPEYITSHSPHTIASTSSSLTSLNSIPNTFASLLDPNRPAFDARNFLTSSLVPPTLPPLPYLPSLNHFEDEVLDLSDLEELAIPY